MNSKKNLIIGGIIIVVLIVGAVLWQGGFLRQGAEIAQQGVAVISNKMTDDNYVEMTAQATFAGMLNQKNIAEEITKKINELLNKNNISTVEFGMYVQALSNDKSRSAELDKKISERLLELQKIGVK